MNETNRTHRNLMELEMSDIYKDGREEREVGSDRGKHLNVRKTRTVKGKIRVSEQRLLILCVSTLVRYGVCAYFHQRRE